MDFSRVKAVAFDMDGTLLNERSELTQETREACEALRQSGRKLLIATGRTYKSALLPLEGLAFDGYVCSNGATLFEADGKPIFCQTLEPQTVLQILEEIGKQPLYYEVHDNESNRWMVQEDRDAMEALIGDDEMIEGISFRRFTFYHLTAIAKRTELIRKIAEGELQIVKIFIWHYDPAVLGQVRQQLLPWESQIQVTTSGQHNVEVIPVGVSKWEGLQHFCRDWGIAGKEWMAFGDADNDREILTQVGFSVAMENGAEAIKQIARYQAKPNTKDGVAQFIREHLL